MLLLATGGMSALVGVLERSLPPLCAGLLGGRARSGASGMGGGGSGGGGRGASGSIRFGSGDTPSFFLQQQQSNMVLKKFPIGRKRLPKAQRRWFVKCQCTLQRTDGEANACIPCARRASACMRRRVYESKSLTQHSDLASHFRHFQ